MALTKNYRETVVIRIQNDPVFTRTLYAEAVAAILNGEPAIGLSQLRDIVHALVTFPELARMTGVPEKSLHRALSMRGNPTTATLGRITSAINKATGYAPHFTMRKITPRCPTSPDGRRDSLTDNAPLL